MDGESQPEDDRNAALWRRLCDSENAFVQARMDFLRHCKDRTEVLRAALHNPSRRGTALRLMDFLSVEEIQSVFDDLVDLASVAHSDLLLTRQVLLTLPREWLAEHVEASAEPVLRQGGGEEYRRLLELYYEIDQDLTRRLAERALKSRNRDVRAAGKDFLAALTTSSGRASSTPPPR